MNMSTNEAGERALQPLPRVEDLRVSPGMTADELLKALGRSGGFSARDVATAADILEQMFRGKMRSAAGEDGCYNFLSFPSNLMATGCRGVLVELVRRGWIDAVVTTAGTLAMDIIRSSRDFYHGSFFMDDVELHDMGIYRLGNILLPSESYGAVVEAWVQPMLEELYKKGNEHSGAGHREFSSRELAHEVGIRLDDDDSLLSWCARMEVPVFVPGVTDGAFGSQLWQFSEAHPDFKLDLLKDEHELSDIVFTRDTTGALMIGGGISKHHVIWWNQFREGLDHAVYITTASETDGSLSGARMREAVSWGKVNVMARHITVNGDATLVLPLLVAALIDRLGT